MCTERGTRYSRLSPVSLSTSTLRIPLTSSPSLIAPWISLMIAGSFGLPGLEQLRDTRQTAGDVLGLRGLARDLDEHVAGMDDVSPSWTTRWEPVGSR